MAAAKSISVSSSSGSGKRWRSMAAWRKRSESVIKRVAWHCFQLPIRIVCRPCRIRYSYDWRNDGKAAAAASQRKIVIASRKHGSKSSETGSVISVNKRSEIKRKA